MLTGVEVASLEFKTRFLVTADKISKCPTKYVASAPAQLLSAIASKVSVRDS